MNEPAVINEVLGTLESRDGKQDRVGRARLLKFGNSLTCSTNYSKLLKGNRFFYAIPREVIKETFAYPKTLHGDFVLLVCGSANKVLVLPRQLIFQVLQDVPTRRVDVYLRDGEFFLKTANHSRLDVTKYLNAFPKPGPIEPVPEETVSEPQQTERVHLKMQLALAKLGHAEGCSVWVPANDRNRLYRNESLVDYTVPRLPNFGFDDNTRRIVQNIDVLWLNKNVVRKAFEVESSTTIYSGLLRMNDLVVSQPYNQIDLYVVTSSARRQKLFNQLIRPSFQQLLPRCEFLSFEFVEKQVAQIESLLGRDVRVSGLMHGERFTLPEHYVYPGNV